MSNNKNSIYEIDEYIESKKKTNISQWTGDESIFKIIDEIKNDSDDS